MRVRRSTELPCDADRAWEELQKPGLLQHVSRPLLSVRFRDGRPERWTVGEHPVSLRLLGVIPLGRQTVGIEVPPSERGEFRLRDNGRGRLVRRWDHLVVIEPLGPGRCRYTDDVEIEAGVLTPVVTAFAWVFYRHRQRRWKRLVEEGFEYGDGARGP